MDDEMMLTGEVCAILKTSRSGLSRLRRDEKLGFPKAFYLKGHIRSPARFWRSQFLAWVAKHRP